MFGKLSKKNAPLDAEPESIFIVAQLNARLQPKHRAELFEDPLDDALQKLGIGTITGGGTSQNEDGEVAYCDIDIQITSANEHAVQSVIGLLEGLGAPRGSTLRMREGERALPFGTTEGMAIYLNGTDLPDEVYQQYDSGVVYSEIERLLDECGEIYSYWQGPTETALYLYGNSFKEMHEKVSGFLATYPLCQKSRIAQIA